MILLERATRGGGEWLRSAAAWDLLNEIAGSWGVNTMSVEQAEGQGVGTLSEGTRASELLMALAATSRLFRGVDGRFHARVAVSGRHEIFGLKSIAFRDWLIAGYVSAYQQLPPQRAVRRVLDALEARARFEVDTPAVYIRVGRDPEDDGATFYLDLGDASGRAIKIGATGWCVVDRPGVHFRRPQGLLPMPMPSHDGSIELLRPFVNLVETDFHLLIGWMAAALRPVGPFPLLAIHGEQGSAKSTLAKVIRELIDPQTAPLLAEPSSTRDLMVTAVNGWLLAYDNVSAIPGWLSDSLCRLASGGGFASRALFSNEDRNVIYAQRPIILNGIEDFVHKGDLADRTVFLQLPAITRTKRRGEDEFWGSFRDAQPRILGGLLDAVAGAVRELPSVRMAELPRMADFARFGEAMGRGLGWASETFLRAYQENREEASASSLENSAVARVLLWKLDMNDGVIDWSPTPTDLLCYLRECTEDKALRASIPRSPAILGNELRRLAPQLRERGILVTFKRTSRGRLICINADTPPVEDDSDVVEDFEDDDDTFDRDES